ncbi:MAG: CRISPR-associated helicase Cas3' [Burkholderiales bacterium]
MKAMLFQDLPRAARCLWAKSGDSQGHGLLAHMLDVAAVAESILRREPRSTVEWAADRFGLDPMAVAGCIGAIVGLHDFGKGIPGFQAKWETGKLAGLGAGLPFGGNAERVDDHASASAALLWRLDVSLAPRQRLAWSVLLAAVAAHHGYVPHRDEIDGARPLGEKPAWAEARQAVLDAYLAATLPAPIGADEFPTPVIAWLAGLTSVSDWIGSNQDWFPPGERHETIAGHFDAARTLAAQALDAIGWPAAHRLLDEDADTVDLLRRMTGVPALEPRPLQTALDHALADVAGPALVLVEAPMGEGKTEGAFLAHLRLQSALDHRGMYVALPTQATGNALFDRALAFLRAFAPSTPLDIQLAHGTAILDERVQRLRHLYGERDDAVASSAWFSQRRRALISPYGVGTVDQALFATLNVKHHFVRAWGLANRVVVLDEVHAYDTYTSGLIEMLLRWLKALGCSVVLMSATLPNARREALLRAWEVQSGERPAYPRLIVADSAGVRGATFAARPMPSIEVIGIEEDLDGIATHALACVTGGGCGCVILNTVKRSQDLYTMLSLRCPPDCELLLFHARYPSDERGAIERRVLDIFGKNGKRPSHALLIATQVVEQSLDLDFDFLLSDLAPMDLLLQRAGRLHRHERHRPLAHREARMLIAGLLRDRPPETKQTAWEFVYDPYILLRTWAIASNEPLWHLPTDVDRLVQRVYGDEALPDDISATTREQIEGWRLGDHLALVQNQRLQAIHAAIDPDAEPQNAWTMKPRGNEEGDGLGIQNRTRLGDDAIAVVPVHVAADGWRLMPDAPSFDPQARIDDGLARRILSRQVRLGRKGVVALLSQTEVPAGFAEHPLLRDLRPLCLEDARAVVGGTVVRLDPTLGVVYDAMNSTVEGGSAP